LTHFKGVFVTSTSASTGDGMAYINPLSVSSAITIHYHLNNSAITYSIPISFAGGVVVNHYDCTNQGTAVAAALGNPSGAQKVFLEAGSASQGKITFNLDPVLMNGKIGINKAELVLSQSPELPHTQFAAPLTLNLQRIDDAGAGQTLDDAAYSSYGGVLTLETASPGLNIYRYRFNITYYFQKLIEGIYHNNGLYLSVVNGNEVADRLVISNPTGDKNYKISLVVTYSKL
jgi:hypothetical protein